MDNVLHFKALYLQKFRIMKIYPDAKINLGLNVVRKRDDGFHDIETVFYHVPICDTIDIEVSDNGDVDCELIITGIAINGNTDDNLVVKAYRMLAADYPLPHVRITLDKGIPTQAGMGGGSSDCAYTLRLLNDMFALGLSKDKLRSYASRLGSDCAFFIDDCPQYAEGKGEMLSPIDGSLSGYYLVVIKPNVAVSTAQAYANVKVGLPDHNCLDVVSCHNVADWRELLHNDFEDSIFPLLPEVKEVKDTLYAHGALFAMMSGSGSAVFGIFDARPKDIDSLFSDYYCKVVKL